MIVGIGVDLVDIARFERTVERTPRLLDRMFGPAEQALSRRSLAARYAAREALIKALGGSGGLQFKDVEITPDAAGRPWFTITGTTAAFVEARGITSLHLSMSHDAGFAIAYVVAEGPDDVELPGSAGFRPEDAATRGTSTDLPATVTGEAAG